MPSDSELALLRADHLEAIRLRALAAKLQLQLKSQSGQIAATNQSTNVPETEDSYWVRKVTANLDAKMSRGQSLLTGGWETTPGKRTFVIIAPTQVDPTGNETSDPHASQITIETIWVEADNNVLSQLGLDQFKVDSDESTKEQLYSKAEAANLGSVAQSVGQNGASEQQADESVTRGDRRRRELEARSSSPPLARLLLGSLTTSGGNWWSDVDRFNYAVIR